MNISLFLKEWYKIKKLDNTVYAEIESQLKTYQEANNNALANKLYLYKIIYDSHLYYIEVFNKLKVKEYYEAWCILERIEININTIKENIAFLDFVDEYGIDFLLNMARNWQSLFPYKFFTSSREIIKKITCSICNEERHFIKDCGHVKGRLYNGMLCTDQVIDFEIITYDIVSNPVNKYSVMFPSSGDNNDYSILEQVLEQIKSERQTFSVSTSEIIFRDHDGVTSPDASCPCRRSIKKYEKCCLMKTHIYIPHKMIDFPIPLYVEPTFRL